MNDRRRMRARRRAPRKPAALSSLPVIDRYREIESVALEMLEAGRAGDWARVGDLGSTIRTLADGVARAGGPDTLDAQQRRERLRILARLVAVDADLRRLSDPASAWLDSMFGPARHDAHNRPL
ncbi:MAG: flagellar protein FliT [Burkholderiaceae bacterium]|nr:flagellar protein FliT [Burkholderiaceae bacterium]